MRIKPLLQCLLIVSLLLGTSGVPAPQVVATKAQPILVALATADPDQIVRVIVQKSGAADAQTAEARAVELGGKITQDLHIINAFAAEMTAGRAYELSRSTGVRWVSLDAPMVESGGPDGSISTTAMVNVYNKAIGADRVWAMGYQGSSITVAVVDSGWVGKEDFRATPGGGAMRLKTRVGFNGNESNLDDHLAHGVHVAGIIGGNGRVSKGKYIGIAPKVQLVSVKVNDKRGEASASGLVAGLQWINDNREAYNIRVVNLSLNSSVAESCDTSPLCAAVEILWFNGIVVVVSAGNNGAAGLYPPANDPFVITVGAVDDRGTASLTDDVMASFSAYGVTERGVPKPDLVAPGKNIVSPLASGGAELSKLHPGHRVDGKTDYFKMSGTSMAAPMVTGAVALLLQDEPELNPDQVKYRLMATANRNWPAYNANMAGAGYLDIYAAVQGTTTQSANTGQVASRLLWTGSEPVTWGSVSWNSVSWNSVSWNSVSWNSVSWNSVSWNSDYWGP
jgi:serine protease AprX